MPIGGANSEPWLFRPDDLHWGAMAGDAYKDWVSKIGKIPNSKDLDNLGFGSTRIFWVSNWYMMFSYRFCHVFQHFCWYLQYNMVQLGKMVLWESTRHAQLFCLLIKVHSLSLSGVAFGSLNQPQRSTCHQGKQIRLRLLGSRPSLPVLSHAQKYGVDHF